MQLVKIRDVLIQRIPQAAMSVLPRASEASGQARLKKVSEFPIRIAAIETELPNVLNKCIGIASLEISPRNYVFKIASNIYPHLQLTKISTNSCVPTSFVVMCGYDGCNEWSHKQPL